MEIKEDKGQQGLSRDKRKNGQRIFMKAFMGKILFEISFIRCIGF